MAGEKENESFLDMSMINLGNLTPVEETKEIKKEEQIEINTTQEKVVETTEVPVDIIDNHADGEDQETVGTQEEENAEVIDSEVDTEPPANSDDEVFKTLGDYLKEQGVLSSLEKKVNTLEDISAAIAEEVTSREYANLNEEQKFYLEELSKGIPNELVQTHLKSQDIYSNITDKMVNDREDIRKELIVQDLLGQGWTQERAERQYQRLYDLGESVEEATIAKNNLQSKEKLAYEDEVKRIADDKVQQEKNVTKRLEELQKNVFDQEDVFDGYKVNEPLKTRVHESMTKIVGYTEKGVPLNSLMKAREDNPVLFETNLYYLWELTGGFKNLSKFTANASTKAANKVKNAVTSSTMFKTSQNNIGQGSGDLKISPIVDIE